jgi:hypothetical protein
MYAVDKDTARNFLENAIGQEVGNFIGSQLVERTGLRDWAEGADKAYERDLQRKQLAERIKLLKSSQIEVPFVEVLYADAGTKASNVMSDAMTPEEQKLALMMGIQNDLKKGLGDYSKLVGALGEADINSLLGAALKKGGTVQFDAASEVSQYLEAMGIKGEIVPPVGESTILNVNYKTDQLVGVASKVFDALSTGMGGRLDLPAQLLYIKDIKASKEDLRKAVVNFVGGRADPEAYQDLFDRIDVATADNRLLNVTYAYAQSDARATYAALRTSYGAFADRVYRQIEKNATEQFEAAEKAPWYVRGFMMESAANVAAGLPVAGIGRNYAIDISYAQDPLAPARLRSDARTSLFIDAALTFGPMALGAVAKGAKLVRTFARLNRFRTAEELGAAVADGAAIERGLSLSAGTARMAAAAETAEAADVAGSATHKAARWQEYLDNGGTWDFSRWSNVYEANMVRARAANAAVDAYHSTLGWGRREVTVSSTVDGVQFPRRLDIADVATQRGIEYKTGYQTANVDNLWEIARDKALLDSGWDVRWVFRDTASQPLKDALTRAGIRWTVGHP